MIGWIILGAVLIFILVLVVRTLQFKPHEQEAVKIEEVAVNEEKIVNDMVAMIQCKTVSHMDESLTDWKEFEKFQALLAERFPLVHEKATLEKIGKTGLLYCIKGKSSEKPSVCMSHYDVYSMASPHL